MPKVLIVDDDGTMVSLLRTLLQLDGFEVAHVHAGRQVLDKARADRPDVVLMDVHLADADGLEVLEEIRHSGDLAHLPVVMSSGMDLEDRCQALGANEFILKPYPPQELATVLRKAMRSGLPDADATN